VSSPVVSVIIPTLQEEKRLGATLAQFTPAVKRTYGVEVIVSDGGSTDATLSIARAAADTVVEHPSGTLRNISRGRNRGASASQGSILVFLNADVVIEDIDKFFTMMTDVIRSASACAATCNVNIYPAEVRVPDVFFHNFFNGYFWCLNLLGMGMGRGECHVVNREVFLKSGGYSEQMAAGEDFEFFLRLRRYGKVKYMRQLTVYESPRRFRKFGYIRISMLWFLNAVSVLFAGHSAVDDWEPVR
jgi:glycosyltransferase involved in cell wall biosynthesis